MKFFYERQAICECGFGYRETALRLPLDEIGEKLSKQSQKHYKRNVLCGLKIKFSEWLIVVPDRDYFISDRPRKGKRKRVVK